MIQKRPRIIPVLLLSNQGLVKTIKFKKPNYLGDPINAVKIFNEKEVDELCLLDIEASKTGQTPDFDFLTDIASEAFMPLSYGGGIRTIDEIQRLFKIGFEKVVLNTSFVENPMLISQAAELVGSQSVVVSIDAKVSFLGKYNVFIKGGNEKSVYTPVEAAKEAERLGAGELIINSIDNDGTMQGYDNKLIKMVTDAVKIPVIACGGAGAIHDLKEIIYESNAHAAAAGSMFVYYGRKKAVLINFPTEEEFVKEGIYR